MQNDDTSDVTAENALFEGVSCWLLCSNDTFWHNILSGDLDFVYNSLICLGKMPVDSPSCVH